MYSNLKLQIWRTGTHQNRLAKMLQVDESMLSRIVNGYREPSIELREKMAALLHCDQAWLFERTEPSPTSEMISSVTPTVVDTDT
jgi:transcriptional regulator with XRE-family HTH domain